GTAAAHPPRRSLRYWSRAPTVGSATLIPSSEMHSPAGPPGARPGPAPGAAHWQRYALHRAPPRSETPPEISLGLRLLEGPSATAHSPAAPDSAGGRLGGGWS